MNYAVAIDGPTGAGKSSIAKELAKRLGILYVDTGAMFRAVALLALRDLTPPYREEDLLGLLEDHAIAFDGSGIGIDGKPVDGLIRSEEISNLSSKVVSTQPGVRKALLEIQQALAKENSLVMEGRDIGSVVLPEAKYKFFLTASPQIRAKRRYDQLMEKGQAANYDQVLEDLLARDKRDSQRKVAPLVQTEDAILIDSSHLSQEETINKMLSYIEEAHCAL
ncbi:MAG: (d)CMP kinase [Tissierellia bacterium]|nr:(d)CMP kinase [Tissierellia bacterium]